MWDGEDQHEVAKFVHLLRPFLTSKKPDTMEEEEEEEEEEKEKSLHRMESDCRT